MKRVLVGGEEGRRGGEAERLGSVGGCSLSK